MKPTQKQRIEQLAAHNLELRAQVSLLTTERDNAREELAKVADQLDGCQHAYHALKPVVPSTAGSPFKLAAAKARELAIKTGKPVKVGA